MATVTVLPACIQFEAAPGETIMAAAQARGYYWPTTCGGQGICTTCLTEVVSGGELLASMSRSERKTLLSERGQAALLQPLRLACQAIVLGAGTLTVAKPGVWAGSSS